MTSPTRAQQVYSYGSGSNIHNYGNNSSSHSSYQNFKFHIRERWILLFVLGIVAMLIVIVLRQNLISRHSRLPYQGYDNLKRSSWSLEFHPLDIAPNPAYSQANINNNFSNKTDDDEAADIATFKIMQIADIHTGEASQLDWGPEQDRKTWKVLDTVIPMEKPDLIVLSGDQLTANNVDENATAYYTIIGKRLSYHGIPFAMIFGNHDDAPNEIPLPNGTIIKVPAKTSREELLAVIQQFPLSMSLSSPENLFGISNYVLNVKYPPAWRRRKRKQQQQPRHLEENDMHNDQQVAVQLFFLDTGGGALPKQLEQNQIQWFTTEHRTDIPGAVVFQHIPTNDFDFDGSMCQGLHDDGVDPINPDANILQVLQQAENVQWLAVGHNHGNDYCCPTTTTSSTSSNNNAATNLHLCFGRHSGYGGYGKWDRGVRMYKLQLHNKDKASSVDLTWMSYVRLENGSIIDTYRPFK